MLNPLDVITTAFRIWWREWVVLLVLNIVWFLLQIPLITAAPATATVYAMAQRSHDGEYWTPRDAWTAFRQLFWPAWKWGLLNLFVWLVGITNLLSYWSTTGTLWFLLRLAWIGGLSLWLVLNFYYWPFWLVQEDRSVRATYTNCFKFLLFHPAPALLLVLVALVMVLLSIVTTLPFTLALMCWLALMGVVAVQRSVEWQAAKSVSEQGLEN
jgi:uncharacterized membrane protein YesL